LQELNNMKKITETQLKNRVNGLREYMAILSEEGPGSVGNAPAAAAPAAAAPAAGAPADNRNIFQKGYDAVSDFHKKNTERFYAKQAADAAANSPEGMAAAKAKLTPSQLKWLGNAQPSPEILQRVPEPTAKEKADAELARMKQLAGTPADPSNPTDQRLAAGTQTANTTAPADPSNPTDARLAAGTQTANTTAPADHGTPYDDEGNMMPGWSKDENNNPVWVGNQDGKTFVEPATQALANQARQTAKEKEIGDNQDREDQERGRDPAQDAQGNYIPISSTQTVTPPAAVTKDQSDGPTGQALARMGISKKDRLDQAFVDRMLGAGKYKAGSAASNLALLKAKPTAAPALTAPAADPRDLEKGNTRGTGQPPTYKSPPEPSQFTNVPYPPTPRPMNVKPLPGRMPAKESVSYADDQTLARIVSLSRR